MKKNVGIVMSVIILLLIVFFILNRQNKIDIIKNRDEIKRIRINGVNYEEASKIEGLVSILEKYKTEKIINPFPKSSLAIIYEIDYMEGHKIKHIELGDIYIIYESSDKGVYEIMEGDKLLVEIKEFLNDESFE